MNKKYEVKDPLVRSLLEQIPKVPEYIKQDRQRIIDQANFAQRVFGKAVEIILSGRENAKLRQA
ncbi:MAG: hypothetical protein GX589_08320 [Deltaproteobacteria bacterium]|nr:hypothetical protein [Deltaproteobacteria bacterium]